MIRIRFLFLMIAGFCALLCCLQRSAGAVATPLTIDLAEDFVNITAGFDGAHLVVFGTKHSEGDLAIVLRGPRKVAVVREKSQIFGVWLNRKSFKFSDVPSFFDFGLSFSDDALMEEGTIALMAEHKIGIDPTFFEHKHNDHPSLPKFQAALLRTEQDKGFYPRESHDIQFLNDNLFRVDFYLPSSVPRGEYEVVAYLMNNGSLIDKERIVLDVKQVGFNATLNNVAYRYSFGYGCLCVLVALVSGWGINVMRRGF